jgi:hypothetical protein
MMFTMLIPYMDLAEETPRVWVGSIEAISLENANHIATELQDDIRQVMDLVIGRDAYHMAENANLEGDELLTSYGLAGDDHEEARGIDRAERDRWDGLPS